MNTIIQYSSKLYYLDLILLLLCLIAIFLNIKYSRFEPRLKYFFLYPLASFLQTISLHIFGLAWDNNNSDTLVYISSELFILIEIASLFYVFYALTEDKRLRKVLLVCCAIYLPIYTLYLFEGLPNLDSNNFYLLHNLTIITGGVISLIDVYKSNKTESIERNPFFIITFGAIIMATCGLPLYIANGFIFNAGLVREMNLYSLNFACYIIFFSFISIAFLCLKKQK